LPLLALAITWHRDLSVLGEITKHTQCLSSIGSFL
jgi:hypothetical protein